MFTKLKSDILGISDKLYQNYIERYQIYTKLCQICTKLYKLHQIIALKGATEGTPGHFVQVFNLDTKEKLGVYQSPEGYVVNAGDLLSETSASYSGI